MLKLIYPRYISFFHCITIYFYLASSRSPADFLSQRRAARTIPTKGKGYQATVETDEETLTHGMVGVVWTLAVECTGIPKDTFL